jgi:murein DD-endopeptidase MepM/ murein hydrolase activator NlpD
MAPATNCMRKLALPIALLLVLVIPATALAHWPVSGASRVSQGYHTNHRGIDIAARTGTPVTAVRPGRVILAGWRNSFGGREVWIRHAANLYTVYAHLNTISVRVNQAVETGTRIGTVGSTGRVTGPHLHFEAWSAWPWSRGAGRFNPSSLVAGGPTRTAATSGTGATAGRILTVRVPAGTRVNLRSGPGWSYRVVGTLARGTRVTLLGTSGGWHRVRLVSGAAVWINRTNVS